MSLQFVIDGYNMLNHPQFSQPHKFSQDPSETILSFIKSKRLTGSAKNKVTVVFDGYPKPHPYACCGNNDKNNCVIFSKELTADDKIKAIVEESSGRKNIVVVTDDLEIKFISRALGARCIGIEEFIHSKDNSRHTKKLDSSEFKLDYSSMHRINQELSRLWLKE